MAPSKKASKRDGETNERKRDRCARFLRVVRSPGRRIHQYASPGDRASRGNLVGLGRFELPTSPLSGVRSNQLSYRPKASAHVTATPMHDMRAIQPAQRKQATCVGARASTLYKGPGCLLLKEVIQPHVPVRLPCYDFTPVISHTVVSALPKVRLPTSGATNFHGVTGGVYKTRERIHRDNADSRLLAIPTSRSRVADSDPDYERLSGIGSPSRVGNPLYRPL